MGEVTLKERARFVQVCVVFDVSFKWWITVGLHTHISLYKGGQIQTGRTHTAPTGWPRLQMCSGMSSFSVLTTFSQMPVTHTHVSIF